MKSLLIGGTAALVLAGGVFFLFQRVPLARAEQEASPASASQQDVQRLRDEVAALRLQSLAQQARTIAAAPSPSEAAPPTSPSSSSAPEDPAEAARRHAEIQSRFERKFAEAQGASDWGRATEQAFRSTLSELPPDQAKQVTAIDCRGSICRVATEHESSAQSLAFMDDMESRPGFSGARFVRIRTAPGRETFEYFVEPRAEAP